MTGRASTFGDYLGMILEDFRGLDPQEREARIRRFLVEGGRGEMKTNQLLWRYDPLRDQVTIEHRYFDCPPHQDGLTSLMAQLGAAGSLRSRKDPGNP